MGAAARRIPHPANLPADLVALCFERLGLAQQGASLTIGLQERVEWRIVAPVPERLSDEVGELADEA